MDGMQKGSSLLSPDPITSSGNWDSSSSIDAPPGLPTITNYYNSPTLCIMLMHLQLLASKILLDDVPLTRDSPSLHGRLVTGAQRPCEGKGSWALLPWYEVELLTGDMQGARDKFLDVPCLLHGKQHPSPWRMGFFFQWCHPLPENKTKEYVLILSSQAQYIYQHWQHCLLYPRQLININPFYASALSNQNTNSRFSICKKLTKSAHAELLCSSNIHHHQEL
jgi:hypothetical protein